MAAPAKYESPQTQLLRLAVAAKLDGLSFDAFWQLARRPDLSPRRSITVRMVDPPVGAVRWPTDAVDRKMWQQAVDASKEGWRRAYDGAPALRRESALPYLMSSLGLVDEGEEMHGYDRASTLA